MKNCFLFPEIAKKMKFFAFWGVLAPPSASVSHRIVRLEAENKSLREKVKKANEVCFIACTFGPG